MANLEDQPPAIEFMHTNDDGLEGQWALVNEGTIGFSELFTTATYIVATHSMAVLVNTITETKSFEWNERTRIG